MSVVHVSNTPGTDMFLSSCGRQCYVIYSAESWDPSALTLALAKWLCECCGQQRQRRKSQQHGRLHRHRGVISRRMVFRWHQVARQMQCFVELAIVRLQIA